MKTDTIFQLYYKNRIYEIRIQNADRDGYKTSYISCRIKTTASCNICKMRLAQYHIITFMTTICQHIIKDPNSVRIFLYWRIDFQTQGNS